MKHIKSNFGGIKCGAHFSKNALINYKKGFNSMKHKPKVFQKIIYKYIGWERSGHEEKRSPTDEEEFWVERTRACAEGSKTEKLCLDREVL